MNKSLVTNVKYLLITIFIMFVVSYYIYLERKIYIADVTIYASMKKSGFTNDIVFIQLFGDISQKSIQDLPLLFRELYGIECKFLDSVAIPKNSYILRKKQYDLSILNDFLVKQKKSQKCLRLLGVIDKDTTNGQYEYLLGMASLSREVATLSLARLREEYYGRAPNNQLFRTRLFKLALHEYAHTFYLLHCENYCLMQFTPQIDKFDNKPIGLCWICRININRKNK